MSVLTLTQAGQTITRTRHYDVFESHTDIKTELTLYFFLVTQVLQQGRPSVQHGLILHPVVVKEEERLLTLLLQRQRGAIAPGLVHLQQVGTGAQPGAAGSAHLRPLNIG